MNVIRGEKILCAAAKRREQKKLIFSVVFAPVLVFGLWLFFVVGAFYF